MSHLFRVQAAPGDPLRPSHQEILEGEQSQLDYTEDGLPRCRRIMKIVQTSIDKGIFPDGSDVRQFLDVIMTEAREGD